MPTYDIETPEPPAWLNANGRKLWVHDLAFRCNAANARTPHEKKIVNREADRRHQGKLGVMRTPKD